MSDPAGAARAAGARWTESCCAQHTGRVESDVAITKTCEQSRMLKIQVVFHVAPKRSKPTACEVTQTDF